MRADWPAKYVGIPYRGKGRDGDGLDCLGLLYLIYANEYGIKLPDYDNYTHEDNGSIEGVFKNGIGEWCRIESRPPGALVMLTIGGHTTHLGIMIGGSQFIHSMQGCDAAIDSLDSYRWKNRIEGIYLWTK